MSAQGQPPIVEAIARRVLRGAIRARGGGRVQAWVTECPACGARVRLELPWWARGWRGGCACGWRGSPGELRADLVAALALAASVVGALVALAVLRGWV